MDSTDKKPQADLPTVKLSDRELTIYQAGQCFGAAQALRQAAEAANNLSQRLNEQAGKQVAEGQRLLDQAFGKTGQEKQGGRLGRRVLKAVGALVGHDD